MYFVNWQIHFPKIPRREERSFYGRLFREIHCREFLTLKGTKGTALLTPFLLCLYKITQTVFHFFFCFAYAF